MRGRALVALESVLVLVVAYATTMVVAGDVVDRLFTALGFGAEGAGVPQGAPLDHVRLVRGVLGAVLVGWALLLLAVVRLGLRTGDARWWWAVTASVGAWALLDTAASLALGSWQHAAFNVPFVLALGLPLAILRPGRVGAATTRPSAP